MRHISIFLRNVFRMRWSRLVQIVYCALKSLLWIHKYTHGAVAWIAQPPSECVCHVVMIEHNILISHAYFTRGSWRGFLSVGFFSRQRLSFWRFLWTWPTLRSTKTIPVFVKRISPTRVSVETTHRKLFCTFTTLFLLGPRPFTFLYSRRKFRLCGIFIFISFVYSYRKLLHRDWSARVF